MADEQAHPRGTPWNALPPHDVPPIIGIAAATGGGSALADFFKGLAPATGFAFVIADTSAGKEGTLSALLEDETPLPVHQINGATDLAADHIYLIPAGHTLELRQGRLRPVGLTDAPRKQRPLDELLYAVAAGQRTPIAVVLAGNAGAADGMAGASAVRERGGLLLVEAPRAGDNGSLSSTMIAAGLADLVLPARELGARLQATVSAQGDTPEQGAEGAPPSSEGAAEADEQAVPPHAPTPIQAAASAAAEADAAGGGDDRGRIAALEAEAARLRERLEAATARYEQATAELQRTNDQLQSTNDDYRAALERFATLFHANPIAVALTRAADGLLVDLNDAAVDLFGYSRDQIIGRKTLDIAGWFPAAKRRESLARLREEGILRDVEMEIVTASNETRVALVTAVLTEMAETPMIISCFVDVTARVAAEREIHRLASELTLSEQAERRRLANILHDDLQQRLYAIQMQLHMLQDDLSGEDPRSAEQMRDVLDRLDETNLMARHLTVDLSPPVLEGEGLTEAVQWLVTQMDERAGLSVALDADDSYQVSNHDLRVLLFQCIRELLTNVLQHAHIDHAEVRLRGDGDRLHIVVADGGAGFDPTGPGKTQEGLGLGGMKRRLGLFGGKLVVDSAPGHGTRVTIEVPLSPASPEATRAR